MLVTGSPDRAFDNMESIIKLLKENGNEEELLNSLSLLWEGVTYIESICSEYDYDATTTANGFRSFVLVIQRFIDKVTDGLTNGRDNIRLIPILTSTAATLLKCLQIVRKIHAKSSHHSDSCVTHEDVGILSEAFTLTEDEVRPFYTKEIGLFWLKADFIADAESSKNFFTLLSLPSFLVKIMFMSSTSYAERVMAKHSINYPLDAMKRSTNLNQFPLRIPGFRRVYQPDMMMIPVDRSYNRWNIHVADSQSPAVIRKKMNHQNNSSLMNTCLVIRPKAEREKDNAINGSLIFHCHGGGGVACDPATFFGLLSGWSDELGVTIVCPDYGKGPDQRYPSGVQDLLDAYFFITSKSDHVVQVIGFHPKHIILTGDSCGGHLAASLTFALNEITRMNSNHDDDVMLPSGLCLQYPCFNPGPIVYPSNGLMMLDTPSFFAISFAFYADNEPPLGQGWHLEAEGAKAGMMRMASRCKDPYFNSLAYTCFHDLRDIPLRMMLCEFDPLLDQGIAMAKKWKGDVKLQVARGLSHGFIHSHNKVPIQEALTEMMLNMKEMLKTREEV